MRKTAEESLQEQGLKQISVFDVLYPEREGNHNQLVINDKKARGNDDYSSEKESFITS